MPDIIPIIDVPVIPDGLIAGLLPPAPMPAIDPIVDTPPIPSALWTFDASIAQTASFTATNATAASTNVTFGIGALQNMIVTSINIQPYATQPYYGQGIDNQAFQFQYQLNQIATNVNYGYFATASGLSFGTNYTETEEETTARAEREVKRGLAGKKAEQLLMMLLTSEQRKQYLEFGYFDTKVNDKTYRINKGWAGNVQLIEKEKAVARFCIHPNEYLPDQDNMIAQFLMLQNNEEAFLKTANKTVLFQ